MTENTREYRRGLALAALAAAPEPLTAAELAEWMRTLAKAEGHPSALWSSLNGLDAAGTLRILENAGQAQQHGEKHVPKQARSAPTWRHSLSKEEARAVPMPDPPAPPAPEGMSALPDTRYAALSRPQLYAMLEVGDLAMGELARLQQEVLRGMETLQQSAAVNARMRRILVEAGLEEHLP